MDNKTAIMILRDWDKKLASQGEQADGDERTVIRLSIVALAERQHAHWIKSKSTEGIFHCSKCGGTVYAYKVMFCAICGAKMDEKEDAGDGR